MTSAANNTHRERHVMPTPQQPAASQTDGGRRRQQQECETQLPG